MIDIDVHLVYLHHYDTRVFSLGYLFLICMVSAYVSFCMVLVFVFISLGYLFFFWFILHGSLLHAACAFHLLCECICPVSKLRKASGVSWQKQTYLTFVLFVILLFANSHLFYLLFFYSQTHICSITLLEEFYYYSNQIHPGFLPKTQAQLVNINFTTLLLADNLMRNK